MEVWFERVCQIYKVATRRTNLALCADGQVEAILGGVEAACALQQTLVNFRQGFPTAFEGKTAHMGPFEHDVPPSTLHIDAPYEFPKLRTSNL